MSRFAVPGLILAFAAPAVCAAPADPGALKLVPFPRQAAMDRGTLDLAKPLAFRCSAASGPVIARAIAAEMRRASLPAPTVARTGRAVAPALAAWLGRPGAPAVTAPPLPAEGGDEAYTLRIAPSGVALRARGEAGLRHAAQTLAQLLRANRTGRSLPCLTIRDWPSLRWRAFQDDLTRGPSSTLAELQREAELGAFLKLNVFTYYMEHQFAFSKHPEIGPRDGSLTPADLAALAAYARPLGVEILGNQQSFAHFANILRHDRYAPLRETADVLTPASEDSYRLLDDLYADEIPALTFPLFNVCGDETAGIGTGPARDMVARLGVGAVYAGHMRRVHELLARRGKQMMMWGDIILQHRDQLAAIPSDTVMLSWGYDPRDSFEAQIVPFKQAGYRFFVCPGVSNWSRVLPDTQESFPNIHNFIRDGAKHGAMGALITAWDDDGQTLNAPNWYGIAWAAECAWNASTTRREDFDRRIGAVLFGHTFGDFGRAMNLLEASARTFGPIGLTNERFWKLDAGPVDIRRAVAAREAMSGPTEALITLRQCRNSATANAELLDALAYGAERFQFVLQREYLRTLGAPLYREAERGGEAALRPLDHIRRGFEVQRGQLAAMRQVFLRLWQRENRPYALEWSMQRFDAADRDLAARIDALRKAAESARAGKPLPPAREFGLEIAP